MSWVVVAKKDFRDAVRARSLWVLSVLFVLAAGGTAYLYAEFIAGSGESVSALGLVGFLLSPVSLFVPVIALLVGYKAVAGERESGSLKLLLGLPHTRRDVVVGKVVGRTGVMVVPIVAGFAVAAVVGLALFTSFSVVDYVLFGVLTCAFALTWVAITVGVSSAVATSGRAAAASLGAWALFQFLWDVVVLLARWGATGFSEFPSLTERPPDWALFLQGLNPSAAYSNGALAFLDASALASVAPQLAQTGSEPFYLSNWFGLVVMAAWVVGPLALGYWRFEDADL